MTVTTGMLGRGFYNRHSAPQWAVIDYVLPWLEDALLSMKLPLVPDTIGLADLDVPRERTQSPPCSVFFLCSASEPLGHSPPFTAISRPTTSPHSSRISEWTADQPFPSTTYIRRWSPARCMISCCHLHFHLRSSFHGLVNAESPIRLGTRFLFRDHT